MLLPVEPRLDCIEALCPRAHACCFDTCRTLFQPHTSHRAIQHTAPSQCTNWLDSFEGMNVVHPEPLSFDSRSTVVDTRAACQTYGVKLPELNSTLFEELLERTTITAEMQKSLVRGWREGFDLGSDLPNEDHLAKPPILDETQQAVLREGLESEVRQGRMIGPLSKPLADGKWFQKH